MEKQIVFTSIYTEVVEEVLANVRGYLEDTNVPKDYIRLSLLRSNLKSLRELTSKQALLEGLEKEYTYLDTLIENKIKELYTVVEVERLPFSEETLKYISYDILEDAGLDIGGIYGKHPKYNILSNYLNTGTRKEETLDSQDVELGDDVYDD